MVAVVIMSAAFLIFAVVFPCGKQCYDFEKKIVDFYGCKKREKDARELFLIIGHPSINGKIKNGESKFHIYSKISL